MILAILILNAVLLLYVVALFLYVYRESVHTRRAFKTVGKYLAALLSGQTEEDPSENSSVYRPSRREKPHGRTFEIHEDLVDEEENPLGVETDTPYETVGLPEGVEPRDFTLDEESGSGVDLGDTVPAAQKPLTAKEIRAMSRAQFEADRAARERG